MDYGKWIERLTDFVSHLGRTSAPRFRERFHVDIAPPLNDDEATTLAELLDCGLPPPLRATQPPRIARRMVNP